MLSGAGPGRTVCEGRASPPAYASALACQADAVIEVKPGAKVSALSVGDKDLLKPGVLVTVAMTKAEDGTRMSAWAWWSSRRRTALAGQNGTVEKPPILPVKSASSSGEKACPVSCAFLCGALLAASPALAQAALKLGKWGVDLTSHG